MSYKYYTKSIEKIAEDQLGEDFLEASFGREAGIEDTFRGGGSGKSGGGSGISREWVQGLQRALKTKADELKLQIDLGRTGLDKDGVDGIYGGKTRGAAKIVGEKLGVAEPIGKSGLPSDELLDKLGLSAPGVKTPAKDEKKPDQEPAPESFPDKLESVVVGGRPFDLTDFIAALPTTMSAPIVDGAQALLEPGEAYTRIKEYKRAVEAGGIAISSSLPRRQLVSISDNAGYQEWLDQVTIVVDEVKTKLEGIKTAVKTTIEDSRKKMGLEPAPARTRAEKQAYDYEWQYWHFPSAVTNGIEIAYKAVRGFIDNLMNRDTEKQRLAGPPASLLALIRAHTEGLTDIDKNTITKEMAVRIGAELMKIRGSKIGQRILPNDTGQYATRGQTENVIADEWRDDVASYADAIRRIIRNSRAPVGASSAGVAQNSNTQSASKVNA